MKTTLTPAAAEYLANEIGGDLEKAVEVFQHFISLCKLEIPEGEGRDPRLRKAARNLIEYQDGWVFGYRTPDPDLRRILEEIEAALQEGDQGSEGEREKDIEKIVLVGAKIVTETLEAYGAGFPASKVEIAYFIQKRLAAALREGEQGPG